MNYNGNIGPKIGLGIYGSSCQPQQANVWGGGILQPASQAFANCCSEDVQSNAAYTVPVQNNNCDEYSIPIAIASVPMQIWRMVYSPEKALSAGTMFAELNLPFLGGNCK